MLFRRNKKVEEALLFYACSETYKRRGVHPKGSPVRYEAAPIVNDHGGRARAALADLQRSSITIRILSVLRLRRHRAAPPVLRVVTVPGPLFPAAGDQAVQAASEALQSSRMDIRRSMIVPTHLLPAFEPPAPDSESTDSNEA